MFSLVNTPQQSKYLGVGKSILFYIVLFLQVPLKPVECSSATFPVKFLRYDLSENFMLTISARVASKKPTESAWFPSLQKTSVKVTSTISNFLSQLWTWNSGVAFSDVLMLQTLHPQPLLLVGVLAFSFIIIHTIYFGHIAPLTKTTSRFPDTYLNSYFCHKSSLCQSHH